MDAAASIENFLAKFPHLLTILLATASFIGGVVWAGIKLWKAKSKRIDIDFSISSSIWRPNNAVVKLRITNNKAKKLLIDKISLVLIEGKKQYELDLVETALEVEPQSFKEIDIAPVSHYGIEGEFVDILHLMHEQNAFYFVLHCGTSKIFIHKPGFLNYKNTIKIQKWNFSFEGVAHSMEWDYGFTYYDKATNEKFVGFWNKKRIASPNWYKEFPTEMVVTEDIVKQVLEMHGFINISFAKLHPSYIPYQPVHARILGTDKFTNIDKEETVIIADKDILGVTREQK